MTLPSAPVRIGIDGFNIAMQRGTGISTYARVLSRTLAAMGHSVDVLYGQDMSNRASPFMREVAFFNRLEQDSKSSAPDFASQRWFRERRASRRGVDAVEVPITGMVDHRQFRMPAFDRILNVPNLFHLASRHFHKHPHFLRVRIPNPPAIMHWTYPIPVRLEGARNIYTVHDLVPLRLPHTTLDDKGYHLKLIRGCIQEGDGICTVSEASRRDIEQLFPESAGRVTNTYQSIDLDAAQVPDANALGDFLQGAFGLQPRGYFLFFGSIEPKKNIARLIEAYLSSGSHTPLVIVGAQSWGDELRLLALHQPPASGVAGPQIRQIEYLPFTTLLRLIRGARAVLFPSLTEGFGLPVVEAMALGTPTLASTEGSLPEIAGEASVLVDPYDTAEIARGIRWLDDDPDLRQRLSTAGPAQAARFGPAPYRARLDAFYQSLPPVR